MKTSEAFLLRKIPYGEADYILSVFTKDFGKISGIAKYAKRSKKRFGGRLEPFVHFRVMFREKRSGLHSIQDAETIRAFPNLMEDVDFFMWGSFVLEYVDVLLPPEEPNERIFSLLIHTLNSLNSSRNPLPVILKFQLYGLSLAGYKPNLRTCVECGGRKLEGEAVFIIGKGGIVCNNCRGEERVRHMISRKILTDRNLIKDNPDKIFKYIQLFTEFTEYHTEKQIKSAKFLEEPKI